MEPVPDDEQRAVIEAPLDDRIFVSAMPGTGKTFCIAQRISHLLRRDKLKAGQEILVLSFSRGAVKVLKERLADLDGNGAFVKAWTFDSFATGLLREHSPEGDDGWAKENYDRRIALVSEWLAPRSGSTQIAPELLAYLRDLKHLFIDEAQDLVGVRLDLVKGLISRMAAA
jgi:superfamily I DNA/RNA helicase